MKKISFPINHPPKIYSTSPSSPLQKDRRLPLLLIGLVLFFGLSTTHTLFGQETAATPIPEKNIYSNSYDENLSASEEEDNILRYEIFTPQFPELDETLRDADQRYFEKILQTLDQIKGELNSTYVTLQDKKLRIDHKARLQGRSYYRADLLLTTNYYNTVLPHIRTNYYLIKGINFLEQLEKTLNKRIASFETDIDMPILEKVTYEMKVLLGIAYMLRGSRRDLLYAANQFEYLLGDNKEKKIFVRDGTKRQQVYSYLASIYNQVHIKTSDLILSRPLAQKKLFYLWSLTELNNADNDALKNIKLQDLADRYVSIMNFNSNNFRNLYSPYVENILNKVKNVEQLVEEAPVIEDAANPR